VVCDGIEMFGVKMIKTYMEIGNFEEEVVYLQ
jgi:hypothetical protein